MIALDTSVVVAGFASWHEHHGPALQMLDQGPYLPAHVAIEAYSVLTRLPSPHRAPPDVVKSFLADRFPDPWLALNANQYQRFIETCVPDIVGGKIYDALIAATVGAAGAKLVTCDRRAIPTYERYGVEISFLT